MFNRLTHWASLLKRDIISVYLAARDKRTPWYAKAVAGLVVAYALSPIDLIPDFIPVLGYLDDLVLVPIGLWAAIALIPPTVLDACREQATEFSVRPVSRRAAVVVVLTWLAAAAAVVWFLVFWPGS